VAITTQFGYGRDRSSNADLHSSSEIWYAIQTHCRHEKVVAFELQTRGVSAFLPLVKEVHRWSDRRKVVELPLFSSYVFVHLVATNETRARVLRTDGVIRFVGQHGEGTPIPDEQIESLKMLVAKNLPFVSHPFLKAGQRVRIRGGALDGLEGIFRSQNGEDTLVVSLDAIQRSLSIQISGYDLEVA
jgi:transcription antitermination factor NusG